MHRFATNVLAATSKFNITKSVYKNSILLKNGLRCASTQTAIEKYFPPRVDFPSRHLGPRDQDIVTMLDLLGYKVKCRQLQCFFISISH